MGKHSLNLSYLYIRSLSYTIPGKDFRKGVDFIMKHGRSCLLLTKGILSVKRKRSRNKNYYLVKDNLELLT